MVRVTFVIDACAREIIAWSATTGGLDGEAVRELIYVPSFILGNRLAMPARHTRSSSVSLLRYA